MMLELVLDIYLSVFFLKQKSSYEMRISDWSSDVCSSDLVQARLEDAVGQQVVEPRVGALDDQGRQRGHGAGGVLDHVAHDRLEAVGDAVELVLQRRGDAHEIGRAHV